MSAVRTRWSGLDDRWVCPVLTALGLGLWLWSLTRFDPSRLLPLGLDSSLGPAFPAAIVVLAAAVALASMRGQTRVLVAAALALFLALDLTPVVLEGTARFPYVFNGYGYADQLFHSGHLNNAFTYENWPLWMAIEAGLRRLAGIGPMAWLLYAPLGLAAVGYLEVYALGRALFSPRVAALGTLVYALVIPGPPYPLPEAIGEVLMLAVVLVAWRVRRGEAHWPVLLPLLIALPLTHLLSALVAASFMVIAGLVALVKRARGLRAPMFAAAAIVVLVSGLWQVAFAPTWTVNTLASHLHNVAPWLVAAPHASAAARGGAVRSAVAAVAALGFSGSPEHTFIVHVRFVITGLLALLALAGFVTEVRKSGAGMMLLVIGCLAAVSSVAAGAYGGEVLSRVYGFGVPFLALMVGPVLARFLAAGPRRWLPALGVVAVLAVGETLLAYGEEVVNYVRPSEIAAVRFFDAHRPDAPFRLVADPQRVWGGSNIEAQYLGREGGSPEFAVTGAAFQTNVHYAGGVVRETVDAARYSVQAYANPTTIVLWRPNAETVR